jgi:hypothetical protein
MNAAEHRPLTATITPYPRSAGWHLDVDQGLMSAPFPAHRCVSAHRSDVAGSQRTILAKQACQMPMASRMVAAGPNSGAVLSQWGLGRGAIPPVAPQEIRSRGCLRAKSSWRCVLLPSGQLAHRRPRKSFMLTNLCRSSRPIPENTNKTSGRAAGIVPAQPASCHMLPCAWGAPC